MKKIFLFGLSAFLCIAGYSQGLYPGIIPYQYSGMNKLINENPYIVQQAKDSFGDWQNVSKYYWEPSSLAGYKKVNSTFNWQNNEWKEVYSNADSFVINTDNLISVAFEKTIYDYPGYSSKEKFRYTYTYNQDKTINTIKIDRAANINSNSYSANAFLKLSYDSTGKRIWDSVYSYEDGAGQFTYYQYNSAGKPVASYDTDTETGDTMSRTFYSYDNGHLTTTYSEYFNETTDDWAIQNVDSMKISNGQITNRITYALFFEGGEISIRPNMNEDYTYNMDGTLAGAVTKRWNGNEWANFSKLDMLYADGKPMLGFVRYAQGDDFETEHSVQYLFNFLTGINENAQANSISALFPNPASEKLNITLSKAESSTCSVFDHTGKLVEQHQAGSGSLQIDLANYPNGIYYLSIRSGGSREQVSTKKFIVAK